MVDVTTRIVIQRPLHEVASFAANPQNAPAWYKNIRSAELLTPMPVGVGARVSFRAQFLGKTLDYTYEVTEYIPSQRMVMKTAEGPFPMETIYTWEATPEGWTQMSLRNRGEPAGFSRIFAPVMAFMMRLANKKDLQLLKKILERT